MIRWPMILERGCSTAKPELCCDQMEVQVGRLTMRIEREMEGAHGSIRAAKELSTIGAPRGNHGHNV